MDYTVHEILQARTLEWAAFPFSRGSYQPRVQTQVSHIAGGFFTSHKGRILWMKSAYKIKNMWRTDTHITTQSPSPHAWREVTVMQQRCAHFPGYPPLPSPSVGGFHPRFTSMWCRGALRSSGAHPPPARAPGPGPSRKWVTVGKQEDKEKKGPVFSTTDQLYYLGSKMLC